MDMFGYLIRMVAVMLLDAVSIALFLRAILSWFGPDENAFSGLLIRLTEPFIYPFRRLFYRMNWFQETPLDMSFLFAVITVSALSFFLTSL